MLLGQPGKPVIDTYSDLSCQILKTVLAILLMFSLVLVFYGFFAGHSYPWTGTNIDVSGVFPPEKAWVANNQSATDDDELTTTLTRVEDLYFGIGASAQMWPKRRWYSEMWWQPGRTRGQVWFDNLPAAAGNGSGPPHKVSPTKDSKAAARLARVLVESVRVAPAGIRWYVIGDDDTIFFVDNLAVALSQFDYRHMYYVGGVSESVEQDVMHSYNLAFGGGGFALSRPLAEALVPLFDGCLRRYDNFYGSDQRVAACVAELGVPLTRHQGFHQLDIRGDAYGLLAAHPIAPLVSLHHLDYLPPIFPSAATRQDAVRTLFKASKADPGRTLQRTFGYYRGWSVSVSWGYSIQIYPYILPVHELEKAVLTFHTWRTSRAEPFTFNTRPLSEDPCRRPMKYFFDNVVMVKAGTVSTYRVQRLGGGSDQGCNQKVEKYMDAMKIEKVEVLAPNMAANYWTKPHRRYCMDMEEKIRGGCLRVRLRHCHPGDSVTPPT